MEHLCASFWFWFVVLASFVVAVAAAGLFGWYTGLEIGRRVERVDWERRITALHLSYGGAGGPTPDTPGADAAQKGS